MPHIPAADLFQAIDPLKKPADIIEFLQRYHLPTELKVHLHNHYEFVLNGDFLNPAKIERSLRYFGEQNEDIISAIQQLVEKYGILDMTKLPSMKLKHDDLFFFWAFETGAFVLLNQIIISGHTDLFGMLQNCFQNGQMYKLGWELLKGKYKGGNNSVAKREAKKLFVFELWEKHQKEWAKLSDKEKYEKLKQLYIQSGGVRRFGKFYAESSFTRSNGDNFFTQFANMQKTS